MSTGTHTPQAGDRIIIKSKPFDDMDTIVTEEVTFDQPDWLGWLVTDDHGHARCFPKHTIVEWTVKG